VVSFFILIFVLSNQSNMSKALEFIELQNLVNQEIEEKGQASQELADKLEVLGDSLTEQEQDEVIFLYKNLEKFNSEYLYIK